MVVSADPNGGDAQQRERTMQQDGNPFQVGQMMRVRETHQLVELVKGPGGKQPGGFYIDTVEHFQAAATYALDHKTRQIAVYLVRDLDNERQ